LPKARAAIHIGMMIYIGLRVLGWLVLIVALMLVGPLFTFAFGGATMRGDWRMATHRVTGLAPDPAVHREAVVQAYASRTFGWRGAFAVHTWVAAKPANADRYTRYEVIGWYARGGGSGLTISNTRAPDAEWYGAAPTLIVDVAGAVRKPGVFEFAPGDRVIDAVERAGGALEKADLTLLNLAAPLADGQQILVPKKGAAPPPGAPIAGGVPGGPTTLVNINTADEATLETLNGVGPVLAAAIIQYRTEHGPFASIDQLDEVSGIGPATLEDLRSQVTV